MLDALNILKHRNNGSNVTDLDWSGGGGEESLVEELLEQLHHKGPWL